MVDMDTVAGILIVEPHHRTVAYEHHMSPRYIGVIEPDIAPSPAADRKHRLWLGIDLEVLEEVGATRFGDV
jgi:hypothetical protein